MSGGADQRPDEPAAEPAPAVTVPPERAEDYRQVAQTAAILGKGLEDLAVAAKLLDAPDPAALGAEGADWSNFKNSGAVLRAWARLVLDNLPAKPAGGLLIVEKRLHRPS